jgi:hypothetical protein
VVFQADAAEARENPVDARIENGLEAALARHQDALVIANYNTTEHCSYLLLTCTRRLGGLRYGVPQAALHGRAAVPAYSKTRYTPSYSFRRGSKQGCRCQLARDAAEAGSGAIGGSEA